MLGQRHKTLAQHWTSVFFQIIPILWYANMEMGIDVLRKTSCSSELDNLACPDRYMK